MNRVKNSKFRLRVGRGSSGLALFTEDNIARDEFVIEYVGSILDDETADSLNNSYLFEVKKNVVIDGSPRYNLARYINHSCRPNCYVEINGRRLFIYAKRKIMDGEELSYHYGNDFFKDYIKPDGCRCLKCSEK